MEEVWSDEKLLNTEYHRSWHFGKETHLCQGSKLKPQSCPDVALTKTSPVWHNSHLNYTKMQERSPNMTEQANVCISFSCFCAISAPIMPYSKTQLGHEQVLLKTSPLIENTGHSDATCSTIFHNSTYKRFSKVSTSQVRKAAQWMCGVT